MECYEFGLIFEKNISFFKKNNTRIFYPNSVIKLFHVMKLFIPKIILLNKLGFVLKSFNENHVFVNVKNLNK